MKRKHYDCIVAWAEGRAIQFKNEVGEWIDLVSYASWDKNIEYRIKKEPVIEIKYYFKEGSAYYEFHPKIPDIWNLKITYQDGKAIKAELPE